MRRAAGRSVKNREEKKLDFENELHAALSLRHYALVKFSDFGVDGASDGSVVWFFQVNFSSFDFSLGSNFFIHFATVGCKECDLITQLFFTYTRTHTHARFIS